MEATEDVPNHSFYKQFALQLPSLLSEGSCTPLPSKIPPRISNQARSSSLPLMQVQLLERSKAANSTNGLTHSARPSPLSSPWIKTKVGSQRLRNVVGTIRDKSVSEEKKKEIQSEVPAGTNETSQEDPWPPVFPPHTDMNTYRLQMLSEDGRVLIQYCQVNDTIEMIKSQISSNPEIGIQADAVKKLLFKIPGAGFLANEHEPVNTIPYFQNSRKRRDDPKFMLVVKGSDYYTQVKHDTVVIGSLLGRPLAWAQHDDENTSFRQCMARIRLQERRYVERERKKINQNIPVNIGDGCIIKKLDKKDKEEKVFITLVLSNDQKKKVEVTAEDTADSFLDKFWKYFPISKEGCEWKDYVLKVVGYDEYFIGPHRMYEFEYVQRAWSTNTEIRVAPIARKLVEVVHEERHYVFEKEEEFLSTDPVIRYDHGELTMALNEGNDLIKSMNLLSVWDITTEFRVKVVGIEGFPASLPRGANVFISMDTYCGDSAICPQLETSLYCLKEGDNSLYWNAFLCTTIKLNDLPRDTKLCFTVSTIKKGKKRPIGWVNCLIYNYKNELRVGKVALKMWPGNPQPIGTCVSNQTEAYAMVLKLEFDEYQQTVVFPTEPLAIPSNNEEDLPQTVEQEISNQLQEIISRHSLSSLTNEEKSLIREYKYYCMQIPNALPKYLMSVPSTDRFAIQEMYKLITKWKPIKPMDALELLGARYADVHIRTYAVEQLEKLVNSQVEDFLLQLVQVLKYESYHDCALSRFLLKRAIRNRRVGHFLYWFLKSELHNEQVSERFGLLLEAFLKGGSDARDAIAAQEQVATALVSIAYKVKDCKSSQDAVPLLRSEVEALNKKWPPKVQLMLDPGFITKGIKPEKCKVMDSKMKPLWLLFQNADPLGEDMNVIFKAGDDLRQDMLTLQMFRIMDKMWKAEKDLDLMLNPYNVIATGGETGLVEVVTKSQTISRIQKQRGAVMGAFDDEVLSRWLRQVNPEETFYNLAVTNFTASCAGYCVATYVLGVGDRHNDNIMIKEDGHLFHIDFGHILGNFKKKIGIRRERVPFVFTPDWAYVMGPTNYSEFVEYCKRAHAILSQNYNLFINLFSMMLISGMPELQTKADLYYLVDTLGVMDKGQKEDFVAILESTGRQISTRVNFMFHNLVHK